MIKCLLVLAIIITVPSFARDPVNVQTDTLKHFATELLNKKAPARGRATAISIAVQCKQNPPIYFAAGVNGFQDKTRVTQNSIFPIGSITKSGSFE